MEEDKFVDIEATAYWSCLDHKNPMSKKFSMDLCNLTDEAIEKIQSLEMPNASPPTIRNRDDEREFFISITSNFPIGLSKAKLEEGATAADIPGMKGPKLGNGSLVRARLRPYVTEYQKKKFTKVGISQLAILNYIAPPEREDNFYEGVDD